MKSHYSLSKNLHFFYFAVTPNVISELAKKCPNLTHLLLDFATASQLHDFTDLSAFPTKLKFLALYLSDTIFLDNFMKRIYRYVLPITKTQQNFHPQFFFFFSFINGLEMVHIVGTYEKAELEEGEVYEVVNIKTLKQATPNLRIINLYGVSFVDDTHVEAFSSNCIQLQVRKLSKWVCRICLFFSKKKKDFYFFVQPFQFC